MKDVTELVIIIDRSGSMYGLEQDVIGGFNALIDAQKKEGNTKVTTIFFNQDVTFMHQGVDIKEIQPLDEHTYVPGGSTALLDAIGEAIVYVKSKQAKEETLPKHTIISIMTDGYENASKEYRYPQIKKMIEAEKKRGWSFIFQAANIDVIAESSKLGIDEESTVSFESTSEGVAECMGLATAMISKARKR